MMSSNPSGPKAKRKQYLCNSSKKVPRQTIYNWKKAEKQNFGDCSVEDSTNFSEDFSSNIEEYLEFNSTAEEANFSSANEGGQDEEKIFEGSEVTVGECIFLLLNFFIKYSITKEALKGLLHLLSLILPKSNKLLKTLFKLNQFIFQFTENYEVKPHYYCGTCSCYIGTKHERTCGNCNTVQKDPCIFVEYPLESVLRSLFEDRHIYKYFEDNSTALKLGNKYEELRHHDLKGKYDVTLAWNTDGVPVFKSSNSQLWPLQICLMDIPAVLKNKFISVCGLWLGKCKPNMNTFLRPFSESLPYLFEKGFKWFHPVSKVEITSKVLAPLAILDAPARAAVLNINQFNGKFGCSFCKNKGDVVARGKGKSRIYKGVEYTKRSNEEVRMHAEQAVIEGKPVFGVKGPTYVSGIPHVDLVTSFSPDYMHCVLLGVVRHFLFLWLDSANHAADWYLGKHTQAIDKKLLEIKHPTFIQRLPRSLKTRKLWKASEFRSWLLYYSLPVLHGILPEKFFQHWILLVYSIYVLLKSSLSYIEINLANVCLEMFVLDIPTLYNEEVSCTFNSHQLLHLADFTKQWGPLWVSSAFAFENNNGNLLRLIHGTQNVTQQLVNTLSMMNGMWFLSSKYIKLPCDHQPQVLGVAVNNVLLPNLLQENVYSIIAGHCEREYKVFRRLKLRSEVYSSKLYIRHTKYRNYCVALRGFYKFGVLEGFLKKEDEILCIVRAFQCLSSGVFCHKLTSTVVPIQFLWQKPTSFL